jgi:hypothetical protein
MMIGVFLVNHVLDGLGLIYLSSIIWKIARRYGVRRWFF